MLAVWESFFSIFSLYSCSVLIRMGREKFCFTFTFLSAAYFVVPLFFVHIKPFVIRLFDILANHVLHFVHCYKIHLQQVSKRNSCSCVCSFCFPFMKSLLVFLCTLAIFSTLLPCIFSCCLFHRCFCLTTFLTCLTTTACIGIGFGTDAFLVHSIYLCFAFPCLTFL